MPVQQIGQYRLDGLLGVGGMGEVYRAYDTRRDRVVALKLLPETLGKDPEYLHRFRRESHVAARLREPHVIPIHDFGEIDGRLFIDMRLVDGHTVRQLLEEHGAMTPERAVQIISQVGEALEAAHADGLVHRDIKPSNVLVTASEFVYVVDFGIARSLGSARSSLTITGVTVGTLDYMAPERFTNEKIDGRADVYSMACLLYECITGRQPFPGEDLPSLMYAHLYTEVPRPSELTSGALAPFDDVIAKGMAKSTEERYATPTALTDAARAALRRQPPAQQESPPNQTVSLPFVGTSSPAAGPVPPRDERPLLSATPRTFPPPGRSGPPLPPPPGVPPLPPSGPRHGRNRRTGLLAALVAVVLLAALVAAVVIVRPGFLVGTDTAQGGDGPATAAPAEQNPATAAPAPVNPPPSIAPSVAVPTVQQIIPAGRTPGYLEMSPNGRFAYIAHRAAGFVSVLDTTINAVVAQIPIPAGPPQFVSFSPSGDRAYVSIFNADYTINLIGIVDTRTNTLLGTVPVGKRPFASSTNPDGSLLYVPSHDDGRIDVIDTASLTLARSIPVARNPHWLTFSEQGNRVYAANHESNVVSVLDAANDAILTTIPVGTSPHSITVSPDGTRVSVVNFDSNSVSVIDTATNGVVATIPVGLRPQDISYAPDGRYMYTANVDGDTLSVIDTATNQVTATIPTGDGPTSVGVRPDGTQAYVTTLNSGTIVVLDITAT